MWKQFKDSIYEVSIEGQVRNSKTLQIIKDRTDRYGYKIITLWLNGKQATCKVHRLVAITYLDNSQNKPQVNHLDNNRTNNNVANLQWATAKENIDHGITSGNISLLRLREEHSKWSKTIDAKEHGKALGLKYKEQNLKQYTSGRE